MEETITVTVLPGAFQVDETRFRRALESSAHLWDTCHVQSFQAQKYPHIYADADPKLKSAYGDIYYLAPTVYEPTLVFDEEAWDAMCMELMYFMFGESAVTPGFRMGHFAGLPFYTLLSVNHNEAILPQGAVQQLKADFLNVASDGMEDDFINNLSGNPDRDDMVDAYTQFRRAVLNCSDHAIIRIR